jgi:glycosyltransferase involved in cell wall biosynthesis
MKLLYLNPLGQVGGAERALLDTIATVRRARPAWEIQLLLGQDGPLAAQAKGLVDQVRILPFPTRLARLGDASMADRSAGSLQGMSSILRFVTNGASSASYFRQLGKTIASIDPDVIHSNGFKMHVLGAWTRPARAALIWHVHDYVSSRPLTSRLLRMLSSRCTAIVANSESVAEDARRQLGNRIEIRTILNGVDLTRFHRDGPSIDLDALAGLPPADSDTVRVGLVATFARWKGHLTFLEALARLDPATNVRGYIVGGPLYQTDGSQHTLPELQAAARRLGVESKIGFTGFVSDSSAAMRSLDVVVHASTAPEPFGLAIAEAMATGTAVVVSFAGGARELATPWVDALVHRPGDADDLAKAIARLAADSALRASLGAAGRRTAVERFDLTRVGRQMLECYQRLSRAAAA